MSYMQGLSINRLKFGSFRLLFTVHRSLAFTLAEVLITLGIIGIIAALTIPALMNNTNEAELRTAWKKAYSVESEAFLHMQADDTVSWSSHVSMKNAFVPYFKVVKDCNASGSDCWHANGVVKTLPLASDGTQVNFNDFSALPGIVTQDGMKIIFSRDFSYLGWLMVDINGDKPPNVAGKDIFAARFNADLGKAYPFDETNYGNCNPTTAASPASLTGLGCSAYYINN